MRVQLESNWCYPYRFGVSILLVGPGWTPIRVGWVWLDMAGHGWVSIGPHWTLAPLGWVPNGVYPPHWGPIGEVGQCEVLLVWVYYKLQVKDQLKTKELLLSDYPTYTILSAHRPFVSTWVLPRLLDKTLMWLC